MRSSPGLKENSGPGLGAPPLARRAGSAYCRAAMSNLASLLRLPRWLIRSWEDTLVDIDEPASPLPDVHEAETVPLPLYGGLVPRQ